MASRLKTVTLEKVTEIKEAAENLNARMSTVNWVRVFGKWYDENSLEKQNLDKVLARFSASACKQDGTDLSSMILKGNQMVFS